MASWISQNTSADGTADYTTLKNVGLGVTAPTHRLDITASAAANWAATIMNTNSDGRGVYISAGDTNNDQPALEVFGGAAPTSLVRVMSGGNVGLGNTTPAVPLAFGNGIGDKIALFTGSGGNYYGLGLQSYLMQLYGETSSSDIAFGYGKSSSFSEVMRVKGSGSVGVGTTSPLGTLHINSTVSGTSRTNNLYISSANNANQKLYIGINSNGGATTGDYASIEYLQENQHWGPLVLQADGGNVGIGTTNPSASLEVVGDVAIDNWTIAGMGGTTPPWDLQSNSVILNNPTNTVGIGTSTANGCSVEIQNASGTIGLRLTLPPSQISPNYYSPMLMFDSTNCSGVNRVFWMRQEQSKFLLNVSDTLLGNRVIILTADTSGNVGIGTTAPSAKLQISNNAAGGSALWILSSDNDALGGINENSNNAEFYLYADSSVNNVLLRASGNSFLNGGNVGVGLTGPNYKLDVNGNINVAAGSGYRVNGTQVVGAQQAHIANATGTLADITTKFNTLLSELQSHGLLHT